MPPAIPHRTRLCALLLGTTTAFLLVAPFAGSAGLRATLLILAACVLIAMYGAGARFALDDLPRAVLATFAAWALLATASVAWSIRPGYTSGELRAEILYGTLAMVVFLLAASDASRWSTWWRALLLGSLVVAAVHLVQELLPFTLTRHSIDGQGGLWSTHLVLIAPLLLVLGWPAPWGGARRPVIQAAAVPLLFWAAWETGNRAVWMALCAQLAVAAALWGRAGASDRRGIDGARKFALVALVVAAIALVVSIRDRIAFASPGESMATALTSDLRPQIWSVAWTEFLDAPWFGHGFGREIVAPAFGAVTTPANHPPVEHAHNLFVDMALQLGAVGLAAFVAVLLALAFEYRACLRDRRAAPLGVIGLALLAGFVVKNLTDDFLHRHNAVVFWALNGMLLGLAHAHSRSFDRAPGPAGHGAAQADAPVEPAVDFTCNVCGKANRGVLLAYAENRENQSCRHCTASLRMRSLMYLLSMELYGKALTLPEFPADKAISGLGMSDWQGYSLALARKFSYRNTFYHQDPRLDIANIDEADVAKHRFLISSDVFEHIPPNAVDAAFRNSRRLLRDDGFFLFTVPFAKLGETREHFPRLHDFRIVEADGKRRLLNRTVDGEEEVFDNLVFHGGDGMTLEMRLFSESDLLRRLEVAGFSSARVHGEHFPEYGILWPIDHSLPIVARA